MTTYRLLNNIFEYQSIYADFWDLDDQCTDISVQFNQANEALLSKLKTKWVPLNIEFKGDKKSITARPDICTWNGSCLIFNTKAKDTLEPLLEGFGELLPLQENYFLFNCLESLGGDAIDPAKTRMELELPDSLHIPKELVFLADKIQGKHLFKPGFALNTFLICQDEFKDVVENAGLVGLIFDKNLAQVFPRKL